MKNSTISLRCSAIAMLIAISSSAHAVVPLTVAASSNDGHVEQNTIDNNIATRWSANGANGTQWLQYDFANTPNLTAINIAFYKGDIRSSRFQIQSSLDGQTWDVELTAQSSGRSVGMEYFPLEHMITSPYVRIVGFGNSSNSWNSIAEVSFEGEQSEAAMQADATASNIPLLAADIRALSSNADGKNSAPNVLDGDFESRWSIKGTGEWLRIDLGSIQTLDNVKLAFFNGTSRQSFFSLQVSNNDKRWNTVIAKAKSSGTSLGLETFNFNQVKARYIRYTGYGNSLNEWNSITEFSVNSANQAVVATPAVVAAPVAAVIKPAPVVKAAPIVKAVPVVKAAPVIKALPVAKAIPIPVPVIAPVAAPVYPVTSDLSHSTGSSCSITVGSTEELKRNSNWNMSPGTTICLKDGVYKNIDLEFGGRGTERKPIVISAITQGNVFFESKARVRMEGSYAIIKGITFQNGHSIGKGLIKTSKKGCDYCRMSEITIQNWDGAKNKKWYYSWNL